MPKLRYHCSLKARHEMGAKELVELSGNSDDGEDDSEEQTGYLTYGNN